MPAASAKSERVSSRPSNVKQERASRSSRRVVSSDDENDDDNDEPQVNGDSEDDPTQSGAREDQGEDGSDDDDEQGTPNNGRKRTRLNEQGDSVHRNSKGKARASPSDEDDDGEGEEDDDQQEEASQQVARQPLKLEPMWRDPDDGFVAGSIVRVKLYNFQTYEGPAEVFPGPYLNLLLGPNGSGKSTIASAIAVGLGFSLSNIGGIATIDKFVRIGADKGYVEIEIKGRKGMRNTVIKRDMNSKNRSSTWTMNGKSVSMKEVVAKVKDFNIQVDNLCAFIPQNRVAEFAAMTPEDLLVRTEQAAGDSNLYAWHQKLIEDGAELQKISADVEAEEGQLKHLEARNRELEREVERWRLRQELEQKARLSIHLAETILINRFTALQDRNGPMHEMKQQLAEEKRSLSDRRDQADQRSRAKFKELSKLQTECGKQDERLDAQVKELENIAEREKRKRGKIQRLKEEIQSLEERIANPPEFEDETAIEAELIQARQEKSTVQAKWDDLEHRLREHADITAGHKVELEQARKDLDELGNVSSQRLQQLRRFDRDCADVVEWLRKPETRARFQYEIAEPAFLSLDIPDPRYRDQIDSLINKIQVKTFVCGCTEDYKLLNKLVTDTPEALGRRARINTWFRPQNESQLKPSPMSPEKMESLGFDGYAIDFIKAPEAMTWYLKMEVNLHRTAIGLDPSKVKEAETIEAVTASGQATFIAGQTAFRVSRSRYGRQLSQTSSFPINKAQNLLFEAIDTQHKQQLEDKIQVCERALATQRARDQELSAEQNATKAEVDACKAQMEAIQNRKKKRAKAVAEHNALGTKLGGVRKTLELELKGGSLEQEKAKAKSELAKIAEHRAQLAIRAAETARNVLRLQAQSTQIAIQWLQVHTNLEALSKLSNTQDSALTRALKAYEAKKAQVDELKQDAVHKREAHEAASGNLTPEQHEKATEQYNDPDMDVDKARETLESAKAQLETIVIHDPGVIKVFNDRAKQIDDLKAVVKNKRAKEENFRKSVQRTHAKWFPALSDLIAGIGEKFSNSFSAIGCAGEVRIGNQDGPYDKWKIEIWVKFRSDTPLCMLTAQRQSGGERSLTTIMYLMAMTEYFRVPFSLVDEINQ
ncbi:Structural maintenance of chromosomes protein 5, partial [Tulasnella sp. UAMH 9824]